MLNSEELNEVSKKLLSAGVINNSALYVEFEGKILELCGVTIKDRKIIIRPEQVL